LSDGAGRRRSRAALRASILIATVSFGSVGPPQAAAAGTGEADAVVLISIDGLRWDHPRRAETPHLARMAREGSSASLVPPFPASTFPSHATLATGVQPDRHGILNNEFLDRERGPFRMADDSSWLLAEPVWATAERQGRRAAVYHWVFSYTPWRGVAATTRLPFSRDVKDDEKASRISEWIGRRGPDRPRLILSYWHGPDAAGHRNGPEAPEVLRRVRQTDRLIGRLIETIARTGRRVALIVVSDHGMAGVTRTHRTDLILSGRAARARAFSTGATSNVYCPDEAACAAAAAALRGIAGVTIFPLQGLPHDLRYALPSRTGDLVVIAPRGSYFEDGPTGRTPALGMHGYRPEEPDMRGVFYAWGAGLRAGARLETIHAVDVAPLVCRLLGIDPPPGTDGRPPAEFLDVTGAAPSGDARPADREAGGVSDLRAAPASGPGPGPP
jgi:predicted AlkP superfamily pyrophosphatase or phosphodiesterase